MAPATCVASSGAVRHEASGRSATFGELAADAARVTLAAEPAIKTPAEFRLIGQEVKRIDTTLKSTGAARFGIDTRLPGMAYAAVANCPVFGGKLKSYDFAAISKRRGILAAMAVTNGVAVVADNFWRAKEALHAMPVEWDFGPAGSTDSAEFAAEYRAALDGPLADGGGHGDIDAAFAKPAKTVEALYEVPYLAHAPMEPLNATAHWREDRIDVWMGTQAPESALAYAAKAGGVDPKAVFVHNCFLGGGFGRRAVNDELTQAVEVSKALKRPIKLIWTREEDIRADRYRPQAALRMRAALREDGAPAGLHFITAVGSITRSLGWGKVENGVERQAVEGLSNCPYRSDALKVGVNLKNTHVPVMFWRSVGSSQNAFAVESFIDECAHAAKRDPVEYRRALLAGRPDFLAVLDTLALKGDWGKPLAKGVGRGVAIHEAFGTIVGEIAEVAVSRSGEVKVQRVVACVDCGHLVNPLTAAMQIESAVMYGLTAALFGEITIKQGRVEEGQFRLLSDRPHGRRAGDRDPLRAVGRRQMGRARRAGHAADRACDRQRRVRRDRQAHPRAAAQERVARGVSERRRGGRAGQRARAAAIEVHLSKRRRPGRSPARFVTHSPVRPGAAQRSDRSCTVAPACRA